MELRSVLFIFLLVGISDGDLDFTRRRGLHPPAPYVPIPLASSSAVQSRILFQNVIPVIRMKDRLLGCKSRLKIPIGVKHVYLSSPRYPNNYRGGLECVYDISSPNGTKMIFICEDFEVPCGHDQILVSASGDTSFADAGLNYCGSQICITKMSVGNKISISLTSKGFTISPRRFQCEITIRHVGTPPTVTTTTARPETTTSSTLEPPTVDVTEVDISGETSSELNTTTESPLTTSTTESPHITASTTQLPPIPASTTESPLTASTTESPLTASTTESLPITASTTQLPPITASTTESPVAASTTESPPTAASTTESPLTSSTTEGSIPDNWPPILPRPAPTPTTVYANTTITTGESLSPKMRPNFSLVIYLLFHLLLIYSVFNF